MTDAAIYVLRRGDGTEIASTYVTGTRRFSPRAWAREETLADLDGTAIREEDLEWTGSGFHDTVTDEPVSLMTVRMVADHGPLSSPAKMLQEA